MLPAGGGATEAVLVCATAGIECGPRGWVAAMIMTRVAFLWLPLGTGILMLPVAMKSARATRA